MIRHALNIATLVALSLLLSVSGVQAQYAPGSMMGQNNRSTTGTQASGHNQAKPDQAFVMAATRGGIMEVALGQMAGQKATNPDVKTFGQRMVTDHTKVNDQLKTLATSKGITQPSAMHPQQQKMADRLSKMSGDEFDRAYIRHMVADHKKDIAEFEREAKNGKDPDVKQFAATNLPTLREHLQMAQTTMKALPKKGLMHRKATTGTGAGMTTH